MPTFTLDDLTTPLTKEQIQQKIYDVMALVGVRTTSWKPGAVVRTMVTGTSIILAAFSRLQAAVARSGFVELAEDKWLTLTAHYVYNVDRDLASFAAGEVTLVNTGGAIYDLDPGDLIVSNPTTGKQYRNLAPVTLGALATEDVAIEAIEAGSASTSAPGTITDLVTPLLGVTCTNAAPVVGEDDQSDPGVRTQCSEKLGSLSPMGPWDAYSYAARNAKRADGSKAGVTRVRTVKDGAGNVTTYVASAAGAVPGAVGNLATDLGVVDEAIQQLAAPLAVTAFTVSATTVTVPVSYRIWMFNTTGLTQAEIEAAIAAKLVAFFALQAIGGNVVSTPPGKLYADAIRTAIGSALPQIFHVIVDAPAGDTSLTIGQVPVLGTVTPVSITQVPPSEGAP